MTEYQQLVFTAAPIAASIIAIMVSMSCVNKFKNMASEIDKESFLDKIVKRLRDKQLPK